MVAKLSIRALAAQSKDTEFDSSDFRLPLSSHS